MKMLTPNEHHTFESEIEKNECLKAHGFTGAVSNGEVPLIYCGVFCKQPALCEAVGCIDNTIGVIQVGTALHKIAWDFLLQMQPSIKVAKQFQETGDMTCIPRMTF